MVYLAVEMALRHSAVADGLSGTLKPKERQ